MITRVRRAMSLDEVASVQRFDRDQRELLGCHWATVLILVLFAIPFAISIGSDLASTLAQFRSTLALRIAGTAVLTIVGGMGLLLVRRPAPRSTADTDAGEVDLLHVHAFAAARAGNVFFFDVGEGQLLCCRGNHLHALARAGTFPNRYFTLVRLPLSKRTLRVECHGEPLEATVVADATIADVPDGAIFSARLDHLHEDLAALVASGWKAT